MAICSASGLNSQNTVIHSKICESLIYASKINTFAIDNFRLQDN
jgi:hypothetical protein